MARPLSPEVIAQICNHMNRDHADAVLHYARAFANCADSSAAHLDAFDAAGMDLSIVTNDGAQTARIDFDHELEDAEDARVTLIALARRAAAQDAGS